MPVYDVTSIDNNRSQSSQMAGQTNAALDVKKLNAVADYGNYNDEDVLACEEAGNTVYKASSLLAEWGPG